LDTYISPSSPRQINVRGPTQVQIIEDVEHGEITVNTFVQASDEILNLLRADSYPRFKQNQVFQEFLKDSDKSENNEEKENGVDDSGQNRDNLSVWFR